MRGLAEARALVETSGRENAGLMIDTLHFSRSRCRLEELDDIEERRFHYVQISDAPGEIPQTREGLIHTAREDRLMPGEGDLDLRGILDRLPADIPIAVEIPNSRLARELTDEERARNAYQATVRLLAADAPAAMESAPLRR
jgi:sugar phosphate isomerase/epimerase